MMNNEVYNKLKVLLSKDTHEEISLMDHAKQHVERLKDELKESKVLKASLKDEYGNSLLSIGNDDKVATFTNYGFDNSTLNYLLWLALYNDSWVFKRAIDKPSQDCIRCGVTLNSHGEDVSEIDRLLRSYRPDLTQLLMWGALFGGSIACMMFNNISDEEYAHPMDYEKIRQSKVMKMYVVDRWYGVSPTYDDVVSNMNDIDFGKPKYYDVTFADGHTIRLHHSYVLRYEHRTAPKLIKNGQLQGWGYAEGSHIINELSRDDKLKASIQSLIDKSLIEVIKMSGMRGIFMGADKENQEQLTKRLEMVNWGRNFNSLTFLDSDDEYQQNTYSGLTGLSDLLEKNMWLIASSLEMQGILFGDLKGGFSNDTEALERYDEVIQCRNESYTRPVYEKLINVLYKMKGINEKVDFEFNSLLIKQHDEQKVVNLTSFSTLLTELLNNGVINLKQYAKSLQTYIATGKVDLYITDEDIEKLDDKMEEELEGIDLDTM